MGRLCLLLPFVAILLSGCHLGEAVKEASVPGADGRTSIQVVKEGLEAAGKAAVAATIGDASVAQCLLRFLKTSITGPSSPAPVATPAAPAK